MISPQRRRELHTVTGWDGQSSKKTSTVLGNEMRWSVLKEDVLLCGWAEVVSPQRRRVAVRLGVLQLARLSVSPATSTNDHSM